MAFLAPIAASAVGSLVNNAVSGGNKPAQMAQINNPVTQAQVNEQYGNSQNALQQQQALVNALQAQGGIGNQSQALEMFRQQALGQGPNPAQQQLANATGANTANQAALMAGQRGTSGNAGLMARQIAQQGAANQQNLAGQSAALQAQQQLAGQQLFGNLATQQVGQQQQAVGGQNQFAQGLYGQTLQGMGNFNNAQVANTQQYNSANSKLNEQLQKSQLGLGAGIGAGIAGLAPQIGQSFGNLLGDTGKFGKEMQIQSMQNITPKNFNDANVNRDIQNSAHGGMIGYAMGGQANMQKNYDNGPRSKAGHAFCNMKAGGKVEGQAQVVGDSERNDTVPAMLSPGEIVIPRSILQGKNPAQGAAKFVQAILAKKGMK